MTETEPHGLGWALKQACYDAWQRDPPAAREAAGRLATLAAAHPGDAELAALAHWTAGIGALTEGRLPDALAALQAAQSRFEAVGDAAHAAETRVPQVMLLSILGRDADAQACAEAALAQFVAAGDLRSAGKVELNLGTMLARQDRHAEAAPHFRRAALRFARVGDAELSIMADGALANALQWQFRFDEALQMFERARLRAQARGLDLLVAQARQGIGQIELQRGRWHRALPELVAAAELVAAHGAPPQRRIEAESTLADAYLAVNLLDEAVALYDRLIAEAAALPAPVEQAWATLQRARALGRRGEHAAALAGFAQAGALYEAAGNPTVLGLVALARGRVELAAGDAAAARASADAALRALAGSGIVGWQLDARLLAATALAAGDDVAAAAADFEAVRRAAAGPPALPQFLGPALAGQGALAWRRGDRAGARQAFEAALAQVEQARAALPGDELRRALGAEAEAVHEALVEIAVAEGDAARTLVDMERGRSRALALALEEAASAVGLASPAADPGADPARLQGLRQQWQQAVAEGDADRGPALAARVQALEQELLEAHRRAQLRAAAVTAIDAGAGATLVTDTADAIRGSGAGVPTVAERPFDRAAAAALPAALGADRALVAYQRLGGRLLACVVTADGVRQHDWPLPDLDEQLRGLRFQIDALRFGGGGAGGAGASLGARHGPLLLARVRARLQALHTRVWAPIVPLLGGRTRVVVLPHRELHELPFAALHDGTQWLVQTHELVHAPSAAVWRALQQRPAPRFERALVLGVGGPGLPQVAAEAAAVAAAFGAGARTRLDAEATRAALEAEAGEVDVLHLACHGRFRADNPAFSFVELADGRLTLYDAARLRLRAGLVTLSACETGASRMAAGDEVLGLVRAFVLAGAGGVLATQWPVDDASTAALIGRFYAGLGAGLAPARALQRAQADAAASGAHPTHWAAFALHGRG
jgi:tetratricopeptide (TPR) repeat protein